VSRERERERERERDGRTPISQHLHAGERGERKGSRALRLRACTRHVTSICGKRRGERGEGRRGKERRGRRGEERRGEERRVEGRGGEERKGEE